MICTTSSNPVIQRKDKLMKQKVKLKKSIDKLLDAYLEHLISLEELRKRIPSLRKQETTLDAELKSLQANELYEQQSKTIILDIESFLVQLRLNADKLDIENRKKILRLLVKDILIAEDAIIINHCIKLKGGTVGENEKSYLLRKGGLLPPSPLRTVLATFTAHGSSISKRLWSAQQPLLRFDGLVHDKQDVA